MTEAEWLACEEPEQLLAHIRSSVTERKLRLFATACCRRLAPHFKDASSLRMVDASEHFADGGVSLDVLNAAFDGAVDAQEAIHWGGGDAVDQSTAEAVLGLRERGDLNQVFERTREAAGALKAAEIWDRMHRKADQGEAASAYQEAGERGEYTERAAQAALVRDIFGNPFRSVPFDPTWLTSDVVALARGIYEERAFDRMPILADALQDAGCTSEDVLTHCRNANATHVRGCWVVDSLLGKS